MLHLYSNNSVLGTVHYLSPEQARGGIATKKSDIYALGIVLYELLTGKLPFSGESAVAIALKHLQTETPSVRNVRSNIPQSLENVVMKATAKNPLHRYRTVEEMQHDLETVLSPDRMDEKIFVPPFDDGATKAMPVINNFPGFDDLANTKIQKRFKMNHLFQKKKRKMALDFGYYWISNNFRVNYFNCISKSIWT
jgi:serine/threonine-protein kinase